jgi:hypothetical protein
MVANVRRNGEKLLVEIDAELFRRSGIDPDRPLDIGIETGRLVLSPVSDDEVDESALEDAVQEMDHRFGRMMKRLAE